MKDTLILLSGGMDSATALFKYHNTIGLSIGFNYGSKHNDKEQKVAKSLANLFGIEHRVVEIDFNALGIKSNLLKSGSDIPDGHYEDPVMKKTVVPFRNGIMLSIATAIAESNNLNSVLISNHAGDHAIYPDCRGEFIDLMSGAMWEGTYSKVELLAPFTKLTKREIALLGRELGVPYEMTWSCYKGGHHHCGKCGTCVERIEALNGFDDTTYMACTYI